jgi:pilus assembly protein CpaB
VQSPDAKSLENVIPVTLALSPTAALAVTYANSFAEEVRLVGLPPGVAQDRSKERKTFDARRLGGKAVPEQAQ